MSKEKKKKSKKKRFTFALKKKSKKKVARDSTSNYSRRNKKKAKKKSKKKYRDYSSFTDEPMSQGTIDSEERCSVIKNDEGSVIIEIEKSRLLTDERLEEQHKQREMTVEVKLQQRLQKLQNTFVKLKKSKGIKKTLRLFQPAKDQEKSRIKSKLKKLFRRIKTENGNESSEFSGQGPDGKEYFCDVCNNGKFFQSKLALHKHMKIHEGKTYRCTYPGCNGIFHDRNKLKRHAIIHTGEKPYKCEVCGKRFGLEFNMKIHQRIHSGEKPFVCKYPGCTRGFNQKTNLAVHEKTHEQRQYIKTSANPTPESKKANDSYYKKQLKDYIYMKQLQSAQKVYFKTKVYENWTCNERFENFTCEETDIEDDEVTAEKTLRADVKEIKPDTFLISMLRQFQRETSKQQSQIEIDRKFAIDCYERSMDRIQGNEESLSLPFSSSGLMYRIERGKYDIYELQNLQAKYHSMTQKQQAISERLIQTGFKPIEVKAE